MMNKLIIETQEANKKDTKITSLRSQNEKLKNELRTKKELLEGMNKPSEAIKYFEEMMRSPRSIRYNFGLRYNKHISSINEGESSKNGDQRNSKSKGKPTCHYLGKCEHSTNIFQRKNGIKTSKPKFIGNFFNFKKVGHKENERRSKKSDYIQI